MVSTSTRRWSVRGAAIVVAGALAASLAALPAGAAFPGDNGKIAFARGQAIISQASNGNERTLVGGLVTAPSWSADGTKITYLKGSLDFGPGWYDVCVMNADGSGKKNLTRSVSRYNAPSFSPDGNRIMFTEYDGNPMGDQRLHTIRTDGTGRRAFAPEVAGSMGEGVWSPDGRSVAYVGGPSGATLRLRVIRSSGDPSTVITLAANLTAGSPDWHPTAARLVFTRLWSFERNRRSIHRINLNGTGLRKLADYGDERGADEAVWSPDGTRIAFDKTNYSNGSTPQVWTMAADGSDKVRVDTNGYDATWQPRP